MQTGTISHRSLASVPALILAFAWSLAGVQAVRADVSYSPDVTVDLDGTIVTDEQVAEDDFAGMVAGRRNKPRIRLEVR